MRLLGVFRKSLRELKRDIWVLILTLIIAPFFVFLYWAMYGGGSTTYSVLVMNNDIGVRLTDGSVVAAGERAIEAMKRMTYAGDSGQPILKVSRVAGRPKAEEMLRNREAAVLSIIPADFSRIQAARTSRSPATGVEAAADASAASMGQGSVVMVGDLTDVVYELVAALLLSVAYFVAGVWLFQRMHLRARRGWRQWS